MNYIFFFVLCLGLTQPLSRADVQSYFSPDKNLEITSTLSPVVPAFNEAFMTATLKDKATACWTYGCIARGFSFSWAPDSSGFLFGVTHITRSMYLYYVHIDSDGDVYPISIDLDTIKNQIAASLPKKHGSSAPKSGSDVDKAKWISSKKCRIDFYQRFMGENADSILELDFEDPFHPAVKVVSTTPK